MWENDWLMRQVNLLAAGLAETITGKSEEVEEIDLDFDDLFGAEPGLLVTMSEGALLAMVRGPDGVDVTRAVALAVGLAGIDEARGKALAILDAALTEAPSLASPEMKALREALSENQTLH